MSAKLGTCGFVASTMATGAVTRWEVLVMGAAPVVVVVSTGADAAVAFTGTAVVLMGAVETSCPFPATTSAIEGNFSLDPWGAGRPHAPVTVFRPAGSADGGVVLAAACGGVAAMGVVGCGCDVGDEGDAGASERLVWTMPLTTSATICGQSRPVVTYKLPSMAWRT